LEFSGIFKEFFVVIFRIFRGFFLDFFALDSTHAFGLFFKSWILYDGENYNTHKAGLKISSGWGENFCIDFDESFREKASSARYTGAPDGYK
jgi:hypothetical protein